MSNPKVVVSFEFDSIEAAVAHFSPAQVELKIPVLGDLKAPDVPPLTPPNGRKPRSDAGKPRGPYKVKESESSAVEAPAESQPAPAAVPVEQPVVTPVPLQPTIDDVKAAMTALAKRKNMQANFDALAKFGVQKASLLPTEKYAEFIQHVQEQSK